MRDEVVELFEDVGRVEFFEIEGQIRDALLLSPSCRQFKLLYLETWLILAYIAQHVNRPITNQYLFELRHKVTKYLA